MVSSKIIGLIGGLTTNRKARIALVVVQLGIMLYAYYTREEANEEPVIE